MDRFQSLNLAARRTRTCARRRDVVRAARAGERDLEPERSPIEPNPLRCPPPSRDSAGDRRVWGSPASGSPGSPLASRGTRKESPWSTSAAPGVSENVPATAGAPSRDAGLVERLLARSVRRQNPRPFREGDHVRMHRVHLAEPDPVLAALERQAPRQSAHQREESLLQLQTLVGQGGDDVPLGIRIQIGIEHHLELSRPEGDPLARRIRKVVRPAHERLAENRNVG